MKSLAGLLLVASCATAPAIPRAIIHRVIVPRIEPAIPNEANAMLRAATRDVQSPDATIDEIHQASVLTVAMQNAVARARRHPTRTNQSAARDAIWRLRQFVKAQVTTKEQTP